MLEQALPPPIVTLIVTTYRTDTLYTQACLESIAGWKRPHHQLIVVTHDESPLLRVYLDARAAEGLIDRLIYAVADHGHTRGYNLAVQFATGNVIVNICNDILIGPGLVDECARQLTSNHQIGIMGWHWYNEGTFWRDGQVVQYELRDSNQPDLMPHDLKNIRSAPWFTGRLFEAMGGSRWLQLCNTGFFAIRREVLTRIGGGFRPEYEHYWADDFLNYAVLDQGLDVRHFPEPYRERPHFFEFQYDQMDVEDRRRHNDDLAEVGGIFEVTKHLNGGLSRKEERYLHWLSRSISDGATVTQVGVWKGASAILMMDALANKRVTFCFIDGFDLAGVSTMSGQPPVTREEFLACIRPQMGRNHVVLVQEANTLDLSEFPRSDFILVDAGHTKECIQHDLALAKKCLTPAGIAVIHDYDQPAWPDVKPAVDAAFSRIEVYETLAIYRGTDPVRLEYLWPEYMQPAEMA